MSNISRKLALAGICGVFIIIAGCAAYPYDNGFYHVPPGLVKHGKVPPGLAKQGKIPSGWYKGKKHQDKFLFYTNSH